MRISRFPEKSSSERHVFVSDSGIAFCVIELTGTRSPVSAKAGYEAMRRLTKLHRPRSLAV